MELKQKGHTAVLDQFKQITVSMKWTTAADFDLAVAYETKAGKPGIVYFGDLGDLTKFPYINLNKDEGVGDKAGNNEEIVKISRLDEMKAVWILCWDYNMVQLGKTARFKDSDVRLTLTNEANQSITVNIDTGELGNVCCLATIDNSTTAGPKLINASKAGTLKGLKTLDELLAIAKSASGVKEFLIT